MTTEQLAIVVPAIVLVVVTGVNAWWQARINKQSLDSQAKINKQSLWGLVGWDVGQRAERGEVWIAGCDVPSDPPKWHCRWCQLEF